jgi:hypothetical protein
VDFLIIMGMLDLGSFLFYTLQIDRVSLAWIFEREAARVRWLFSLEVLSVILCGGLVYLMVRGLTERGGRMASAGG